MKIYTKTGDEGETGLLGDSRVSKDDLRIETYGTFDELNAVIGIARAEPLPADVDALLADIQDDLFALGAELASVRPSAARSSGIAAAHIARLEQAIDQHEQRLAPLRQFILPGGSRAAAMLHFARTVCRRAERRLVTLVRESPQPISPELIVYANRLSDLLFVLVRSVNAAEGRPDVPWRKA